MDHGGRHERRESGDVCDLEIGLPRIRPAEKFASILLEVRTVVPAMEGALEADVPVKSRHNLFPVVGL
jgi:hypothetical protein